MISENYLKYNMYHKNLFYGSKIYLRFRNNRDSWSEIFFERYSTVSQMRHKICFIDNMRTYYVLNINTSVPLYYPATKIIAMTGE